VGDNLVRLGFIQGVEVVADHRHFVEPDFMNGKARESEITCIVIQLEIANFKARVNELQEMAAGMNSLADELSIKAEVQRPSATAIGNGHRQRPSATAIGNGDLASEVNVVSGKDTLGHALQNMITNLNQMIAGIYQAAEQVNTSAGHIADSNQSLSQGATEQAASVEQISSSMEEIGSQSRTNADNAGHASQLAVTARNSGATSVDRMNEMNTAMQSIDESRKEIQKIIKVIDDIAFQTNLPALNAAVEAARAGKHGKGFAVVAQEVRSLAERSAKAAKETEGLIQDAMDRMTDGTGIAENVPTALTEMNEKVVKISDILQEISEASKEQAQGISQVNDGIGQVDAVTQQNTANAEETAAAAEELSGQASPVRNTLARFKLQKEHGTRAIADGAGTRAPYPSEHNPAL
ncbi:MAG: methyl-accepting chemotaxis protein, partial [Thermodesulfobacteriota bacterium]|nr:methyl-accepting chemotaxis protein [Thermodesulfobacteriota bacterium]